MIARHRSIHRWVWTLLALLLPVLFVLALQARPPMPSDGVPAALAAGAADDATEYGR